MAMIKLGTPRIMVSISAKSTKSSPCNLYYTTRIIQYSQKERGNGIRSKIAHLAILLPLPYLYGLTRETFHKVCQLN